MCGVSMGEKSERESNSSSSLPMNPQGMDPLKIHEPPEKHPL